MYIIQPLVPIPSDPVLTQPQPSSHARWKSRYMVNKLTSIITSSLQDPGFFEAAPPSWRVPAPTTALSLQKLPPTTGSASLQHPGGSPVTLPPSSPLFHNSNPLHGQNWSLSSPITTSPLQAVFQTSFLSFLKPAYFPTSCTNSHFPSARLPIQSPHHFLCYPLLSSCPHCLLCQLRI